MIDDQPRFQLELLRWYATLTRSAGVDPRDLVVHLVGGGTSPVLDYMRNQCVRLTEVDPFDGRSPHCNKIAGALALDPVGEIVVLTDSDVVILEDLRRINVPARRLALKQVDAGNPSLQVLKAVFHEAKLVVPATIPIEWRPDESTLLGNGNGGLYILQAALLPELAAEWSRWARWLLDRSSLLGDWSVHVDQVAMCMTLAATGVQPLILDARWNMPIHEPNLIPSDVSRPAVIHYHDQGDDILLRTTGVAVIDEEIACANEAIIAVWRECFGEVPTKKRATGTRLSSIVRRFGSLNEALQAKFRWRM